ncbi:hypothetical protein D3C71_1869900 [compost metagenome]
MSFIQQSRIIQSAFITAGSVDVSSLNEGITVLFWHIEVTHAAPARIARRFALRHRNGLDHWFNIFVQCYIAFFWISPINALHTAATIGLSFRSKHIVYHFN